MTTFIVQIINSVSLVLCRLAKSVVHRGLATLLLGTLVLVQAQAAKAEGFTDLYTTKLGCYDRVTYGVGLLGVSSGTITVNSPGPIVGAYVEWTSRSHHPTAASSLTINGVNVPGLVPAGVAANDTAQYDWFDNSTGVWRRAIEYYNTWHADIGPDGAGIISSGGNTTLNIAVSGAIYYTFGATVTIVYDTAPCTHYKQLQHKVGVDFSFYGRDYIPVGDDSNSNLLIFSVPNLPVDKNATMVFAHGGTHQDYTASCRGRAIWMKAGAGSQPDPYSYELVQSSGSYLHGQGINGGVEIVNDPFVGGNPACTLRVNPAPDYPYAAGHPYPNGAAGGANSSPYYAISVTPPEGGDDGPEWGVIEVEVNIPAGSDWLAFQLESEGDTFGESGVWSGSALTINELVSASGSLRVSKDLTGYASGYDPNLLTFTIDVTCDAGGINQTLSLKHGQSQTISNIPGGANCSLNERNIPNAPTGYKWNTVGYSPAQSVTITANQTLDATVNNSMAQDFGSLEITKQVTGGPSTGSFTVALDCDGSAYDQVLVLTHNVPQTVTGIPNGTTCSASETNKPSLPEGYFWAPESISGPVVISTATTQTITVTNPVLNVDLAVDKQASKVGAASGETVIYTLSVSNLGSALAEGVFVTDALPLEVTYISDNAPASGTSYANDIWTIGNLAPGATISLQITVRVK